MIVICLFYTHTRIIVTFYHLVSSFSINIFFVSQILSFIHAESTFFHQGTDSFQDMEADLKTAAANLETFAVGKSLALGRRACEDDCFAFNIEFQLLSI